MDFQALTDDESQDVIGALRVGFSRPEVIPKYWVDDGAFLTVFSIHDIAKGACQRIDKGFD
ncbi:Unknown protein sequence [Pseudomonas amygdali pv. lachrymans]|nr:Unknown protein sequence [Pseudomonas amygdali pv. lachrymans]